MGAGLHVWLCLLFAFLAVATAQEGSTLKPAETYFSSNNTLLAPEVALQGSPLGVVPSGSPSGCSSQCLAEPLCSWFNHCSRQVSDWQLQALGAGRHRPPAKAGWPLVYRRIASLHTCCLAAGWLQPA